MKINTITSLIFIFALIFSCTPPERGVRNTDNESSIEEDENFSNETTENHPKKEKKVASQPSRKQVKSSRYQFPHTTSIDFEDLDFSSCSDDPEDDLLTIGNEFEKQILNTLVSIDAETENDIGEQIHETFNYRYIKDERYRKVKSIFNKMKPYIERKDINYQIFVIQDNVINAWTIPGGNIYITTGIILAAKNDDELANIIGHEIGHNENGHTKKSLQRQLPVMIFQDDIVAEMVNIYSQVTIAYNQPNELESDMAGFYLSAKAGYDPLIGLEFWKRMAKDESANRLDKFFRSHPYSNTRYNCGKDHLDSCKK
jgi:hypothetical protein